MIQHRLLPRRASLALTVGKAVALGLLLTVLATQLLGHTPAPSQSPSALRLESAPKGLARAMTQHDCTTTGFGDTASPRSALIRRQGQLRHVSFEQAWSVFTGDEPGELLAVCRSEA